MAAILLIVAWMLTYLVHSTVLLGGAWLVSAFGVVRSSLARDTLWKAALVGGLVSSTVVVAFHPEPLSGHLSLSSRVESPLIDVARVPRTDASTASRPTPAGADFAVLGSGEAGAGVEPPAAASSGWVESSEAERSRQLVNDVHIGIPALLIHFWLMGAVAFGGCVVAARRRLSRRLASRRPITGGPLLAMLADLAAAAGVRSPRLWVSGKVPGPITFGRRDICLPERALTALSPQEQRAMLAHELGHVVRRDPAWLLLAAAVENLLFFQPLNRVARSRIQECSEFLCDDFAARLAGGGVVLARCLAEVAGWVNAPARPALASGMAESRSLLVARVQRLLEQAPARPDAGAAWRLSLSAAAVAAVAWLVPGVTAGRLAAEPASDEAALPSGDWRVEPAAGKAPEGEVWLSLREGGRLLSLHPGYAARLSGSGRLGFRQWGQSFELPEGLRASTNGRVLTGDWVFCAGDGAVRIVDQGGRTRWTLEPVRVESHALALGEHVDRAVTEALSQVRVRVDGGGDVRVSIDTNVAHGGGWEDAAEVEARLDASLDSIFEAWVHDPEALRAAARRIARQYERDFKPRLESLGVEVGREIAPQLERLTAYLARDLTPEFARLGAELGRSMLESLADLAEDNRPGARDYREPKRHKTR